MGAGHFHMRSRANHKLNLKGSLRICDTKRPETRIEATEESIPLLDVQMIDFSISSLASSMSALVSERRTCIPKSAADLLTSINPSTGVVMALLHDLNINLAL